MPYDPMLDMQSMNASDLAYPPTPQQYALPQSNQPMPSFAPQPPQMQPQQQQDPNAGMLKAIFGQMQQNKQGMQDQGGIIQQILANRMQPEAQDVARSITQTAQAYGAPDLFKAATPDQAVGQRVEDQLAPYTSALALQAKIKNIKNSGGATGELVDRLMRENPGMTFGQALQQVQTGYRQGIILDAQGNAVPIPGFGAAKGNINYQAQGGTNKANVESAGPQATNAAAGTIMGHNQATAEVGLPAAIDDATFVKQKITELVNHPGKGASLGASSYFPTLRGSKSADFQNRLEQLNSEAFLQAFNNLRGGGSISNAEGDKATSAKSRMQLATSEDEFNKAANDYVTVIDQALTRMQNAAGGTPRAATQTQNAQPSLTLGQPSISQDAINHLRQNPSLAPAFEQKYGISAKSYLQ